MGAKQIAEEARKVVDARKAVPAKTRQAIPRGVRYCAHDRHAKEALKNLTHLTRAIKALLGRKTFAEWRQSWNEYCAKRRQQNGRVPAALIDGLGAFSLR